jgi:acylphosphatase
MSPERVRAHLWINGTVQGVGFRFFAERAARRHGVSGFVRNLPDGRVEAAAEGEREAVDRFIAALRAGPSGAVVRDVDVQWEQAQGNQGFVIR